MPLPQEKKEQEILYSNEQIPSHLESTIGPIKHNLQKSISFDSKYLYSTLPTAPNHLSLEESVDRYIENFNDYGIFTGMQDRSAKQYMEREHQKSFAKAYFVPLLYKVFEFCHEKGHANMAQAMAYNIKDETGSRPKTDGKNNYKDDKNYVQQKAIEGEEYKLEAHEQRRLYEYEGIKREYLKIGNSEDISGQGRNTGMKIFNIITGEFLSNNSEENNYEAIGAVMFLEKFIPYEFKFMQSARNRLFPGLNAKEKHYIDDHILHDEEFHYQDILKGIDNMDLSEDKKKRIANGIHKLYIGREYMFSAFANQIKPSTLTKILNIPAIKYIKKYGIAASIVLGTSLVVNHIYQDKRTDGENLYLVNDIEHYEKIIAEREGVWREYSSGTSENFIMIDYIGYEALREAIKDQKGVDIGPYL